MGKKQGRIHTEGAQPSQCVVGQTPRKDNFLLIFFGKIKTNFYSHCVSFVLYSIILLLFIFFSPYFFLKN